jgi:hypothetical protein
VPLEAVCAECGRDFNRSKSDARFRFCSVPCRERSNQRRKDYNKRARRKLIRAAEEEISLAYVWEREAGLCWNCRYPERSVSLDPEVPAHLRATIDHLDPLSLGGTHEKHLVRLAHHGCNAARGNRGSGEQTILAW